MMMLVCFDLPRETKLLRRQANRYQKRLVELGFTMKQYSLYEREIINHSTREKVINVLKKELPEYGSITVYQLPNEVNDNQINILGESVIKTTLRKAKFVVL